MCLSGKEKQGTMKQETSSSRTDPTAKFGWISSTIYRGHKILHAHEFIYTNEYMKLNVTF